MSPLGPEPEGIAVALRDVSLVLGGRRVVNRVSLDLAPGSHTLLVGANGAGKSQLLKLLAAQRWPTPTRRARRTYTDARGRPLDLREVGPRLQLVSAEQQDRYERYGWSFTVATVVGTGCRGLDAPLGPLNAGERALVRRCLLATGLFALRRRHFLGLSYGERRLTLIARALAARPGLLLLDEIYNGLDRVHRRRVERLLGVLCRTGLTIVASAHRPEDAHPGLTQALAIDAGRVRYAGDRAGLPRNFCGLIEPAPSGASPTVPASGAAVDHRAPPLIRLENVSVFRDYRPVIRGLSVTIRTGEHWAVLGVNGSGKTTLLNLLHGNLPAADRGQVLRAGHSRGSPIEEWQSGVRLITPDDHVWYHGEATLEGVVLTGLPHLRRTGARATPAQRRDARAALGRVGLAGLARRAPRAVSYGQLRLCLFARALIGEPRALLLDEPLTGLDAGARARVRALMSALARSGITLIVAVHHREDLVPEITRVLTLPGRRYSRHR